jgi:hypothetical protein
MTLLAAWAQPGAYSGPPPVHPLLMSPPGWGPTLLACLYLIQAKNGASADIYDTATRPLSRWRLPSPEWGALVASWNED